MHYNVEDLAAASGVKVDTIRFYQGKGLIRPPAKQGRNAIYGTTHLARIGQIRSLLGDGFSLAQIHRVAAPGESPLSDPGERDKLPDANTNPPLNPEVIDRPRTDALLRVLAQERSGEGKFQRSELAARAGIPEEIVAAAQNAGLLKPSQQDGQDFFSSVDLEMLESGIAILGAGLPLSDFLELSAQHDQNIKEISERGIDLFGDHIRRAETDGDDPEVVARAFQEIMPRLTRLVALHFQRTLVNRAMERLRASGDGPALERALATVEATHLDSEWRR